MLAVLHQYAQQFVAILTVAGVVFAYFQLQNASRSRLAATYLAISKEWDSLVGARTLITMSAFEDRDIEHNAERGALLLEILGREKPFLQGDVTTSIENEILCSDLDRSLDTILSYLEDLGLLCRRHYVSQKDVADIIGPSIAEIVEIMLPYIEKERREYDVGPTVYANTLWLYERERAAKQFSLPGYGTPQLFFRRAPNAP